MTNQQNLPNKNMDNIAIILAGGSGTRLDKNQPKQFIKFAGITCLEHTLTAFYQNEKINKIIIACHPKYINKTKEITKKYSQKPIHITAGGNTRNTSTFNSLNFINTQLKPTKHTNVLIHDATRPLISQKIINNCIIALDTNLAINVAIPVTDTIIAIENQHIKHIPNRNNLMHGQTPQGFKFNDIHSAYNTAIDTKLKLNKFSDDCGVFLANNPANKIYIVPGEITNIKLTHPEDIPLLNRTLQLKRINQKVTNQNKKFHNKVAIIFGGSSGIGLAILKLLAKHNCQTYSLSRQNNCDIQNLKSIKNALTTIYQKTNRIDFIINTAGILTKSNLLSTSEQQIIAMTQTNYLGSVFIAQAAHQYLKESQGQLILTASSSYTRGRENYAIYSSLKSAIVNLTQAIAAEWSKDKIQVNCISPSKTNTPMRQKNFPNESASTLLTPEYVALQTLKLMCNHTTGEILDI